METWSQHTTWQSDVHKPQKVECSKSLWIVQVLMDSRQNSALPRPYRQFPRNSKCVNVPGSSSRSLVDWGKEAVFKPLSGSPVAASNQSEKSVRRSGRFDGNLPDPRTRLSESQTWSAWGWNSPWSTVYIDRRVNRLVYNRERHLDLSSLNSPVDRLVLTNTRQQWHQNIYLLKKRIGTG